MGHPTVCMWGERLGRGSIFPSLNRTLESSSLPLSSLCACEDCISLGFAPWVEVAGTSLARLWRGFPLFPRLWGAPYPCSLHTPLTVYFL